MYVIIPTVMRSHTGGLSRVCVQGESVDDVLKQLVKQHPDLQHHLFDSEGRLVSFVNVFVNDENIRDLDQGNTKLSDTDDVLLVPAIAGG
ncbi:MoaD/ThiS family protein [Neorhodopirellula pilleata]|uniref:Sulfur carrier protein CysO n=1 Tax=Neorhodopirellula pilleata TaxID=2714738 RepID=A0A5C5ZY83_9BACT|nr:MoaD/ThiS family protein [Neorhodopirellula pilleata]TWT92632.1 Sulfur carrier protein CysO [Neorhodopirellula pilleata]